MAASTTAQFSARLGFSTVNQISAGLSSPVNVDVPSGGTTTSLPNGSTAGSVTTGWADTRTLAASTPVTLDLTALASAATNTGAASFAKVVGLLIVNNAAPDSGNDLIVGNAASLPFAGNWGGGTATVTVKAGCSLLVTDLSTAAMPCGANKNLKLDPGTGTCSVTVVIVGR